MDRTAGRRTSQGLRWRPRLIAAGRSYAAEEKPFRDAGTERPKKEAATVDGWVSELKVVATPDAEAVLTDGAAQAAAEPRVDPATATLIGNDDDPTFERIADTYPAMEPSRDRRRSGAPAGHRRRSARPAGRQPVDPAPRLVRGRRSSHAARPRGRAFPPPDAPRLSPILTLNTSRDGVEYELTVFGGSEGFQADKDLIAYVGLAVKGSSEAASAASLVWRATAPARRSR